MLLTVVSIQPWFQINQRLTLDLIMGGNQRHGLQRSRRPLRLEFSQKQTLRSKHGHQSKYLRVTGKGVLACILTYEWALIKVWRTISCHQNFNFITRNTLKINITVIVTGKLSELQVKNMSVPTILIYDICPSATATLGASPNDRSLEETEQYTHQRKHGHQSTSRPDTIKKKRWWFSLAEEGNCCSSTCILRKTSRKKRLTLLFCSPCYLVVIWMSLLRAHGASWSVLAAEGSFQTLHDI